MSVYNVQFENGLLNQVYLIMFLRNLYNLYFFVSKELKISKRKFLSISPSLLTILNPGAMSIFEFVWTPSFLTL